VATTELAPGLVSVGQGIFSAVPGVMQLSEKFGGLGGMLSAGTGAISGFGSTLLGIATGPVGIAIAAIIALGVAVYEVGKYFGWWKDLPGMFSAIQTGIGELWNAFMSNEYVIQAIDLIKQGLTDAWNAIVGFGQAVMSALGGAGGQFDILSWAINGLQIVLNAVGPVVILAIQGMIQHFRNIYTVAQIVWPYVAQIINGAIGVIRGIISGAMGIWSGLQGAWHGLQSTASAVFGAINGVVSAAGGAWQSFKSTVMGVIQPIIDKIHELKSVADGIGDFIGGLVGGGGGIETPTVNTGYGSGGYTTVSQGNTIIFNMYGDIRDERTLDETIDAINNRIQFDALANGIGDNGSGAI
jgi:phage-related protein